MHRVANRIAHVTKKLRQGVDWSDARFGVNHAHSISNLHRVLPLTQEEAARLTLDGDAQEVVMLPQIFHGELLLQG
jgi:hypothetical protein